MRRECEPVAGKRAGSGFANDVRGNVAILFGIVCVPVMVLMGLAVDTARALLAAETAQNALDASALAAAQALTRGGADDSKVQEVANDHFLANAAGKVSFASFGPVQVESNRETGAVTVSVDTVVETTLGALAQIEEISMRRSATALMGMGDIEVGLMLDVTDSMKPHGKLDALKAATADLIDALIPEGDNSGRVRIALAPYSEQVNVGGLMRQVRDGLPPEEFKHDHCVAERSGRYANTDAAPTRHAKFHVLTQGERDKYEEENSEDNRGKPACPPAVIQPLSSDAGRLKEIVNGYGTAGYTAGHLGIQWAWNLISPEWGGVLPGGSRPKPYGEKDLIKAVVLMTDGEFNTAYTGALDKDSMTRESFDHASDLCENIKREDVIVFSVAFHLDKPRARRALKNCASSGDYFYRAENEEELRRAYRDIAVKLTALRISK